MIQEEAEKQREKVLREEACFQLLCEELLFFFKILSII